MPQEPNLYEHHLPPQRELGNILLSQQQVYHRANLACSCFQLGKTLTSEKVLFERKWEIKTDIGVGLVVLLIKYLLVKMELRSIF